VTDVRAPQARGTEATGPFGTEETGATESFSGGVSAPPDAGAGWPRWAWRQLTSMRTALILLFLLALGSIPGSILPQQGTDPASVSQYFTSHPLLATWLNHLGLFNVYAAPWFAAIYLLLFASLIGCVVPRTFRLVGTARTPPPRAPRNLKRLPHSTTYDSALPPEAAVASAAGILGGQRFRLRRPAEGDSGHWVSAEKGYLREVGNLLFHLSLVGVLVSVALGGLFGYKGYELLVQGDKFADTQSALAEFEPGHFVTGSDLAPFSLKLNDFSASYITSGQNEGQPSSFQAAVTYWDTPGGAAHNDVITVNHPLSVDSTKVYLIGHGYAPVFKVTGPGGTVDYDAATPFIPANTSTMLSDGVVKAPDASLGFMGVFVPTAISDNGTLESVFPAANYPVVSLIGYSGNLGMNSGVPQSVYQLDTTGMSKVSGSPHLMLPGQTWTLPDGKGSITFVGVQQWVSLAITYDPGQVLALVFGMLALAGLLLSFFIRRRRVFVRAVPAASGSGSVVTIGGLTRTDASGGFEQEFAELAYEIASAGAVGAIGSGAPGNASPGDTPPGDNSPGDNSPGAAEAAAVTAGDDKPEPNNQSETGA
jgi:cytochrome c biogenesis protein